MVAIETETSVSSIVLDRQFARTPYAVSFAADRLQLTLVTLHVLYGEESARADELREIAGWLARWAKEERQWNQNLIALGDFNIDRRGDLLFDAFTSTALSMLEPAIIIVMGVIVALIVLSILLPILQLETLAGGY